MICSNCGADIGDSETKCPYCGAMQYKTSEEKYMKDLYNLNDGMETLDKKSKQYIIKSTLKSAGIVCAAIVAAALIGTGFGYASYSEMYDSLRNRKEIHEAFDWYNDNVNELNTLYEKADYKQAAKLLSEHKGNSDVIGRWKHYNFINLYDILYSNIEDTYNDSNVKTLDKYEFKGCFRGSMDILHFADNKNDYNYRKYEQCQPEEKMIVDGWCTQAEHFLKNTAGLSDKEITDLLDELYQDGYYSYKLGEKYEDSFYEKYSGGGNN